jgi:hypothetical protein
MMKRAARWPQGFAVLKRVLRDFTTKALKTRQKNAGQKNEEFQSRPSFFCLAFFCLVFDANYR